MNTNAPWLRAWFIEIDGKGLSLSMPVIPVYLREVGLGFGYRFTLTAIKAADQSNDIKALLNELDRLVTTQSDLARQDGWTVDLENPDQRDRSETILRCRNSLKTR